MKPELLFLLSGVFLTVVFGHFTHIRSYDNEIVDIIHDMFDYQDYEGVVDFLLISLLVSQFVLAGIKRDQAMVSKVFFIYGLLYFERLSLVLLTTFPDPNPRCENKLFSRSLLDHFQRYFFDSGFITCGDMIFSGHASSAILACCTFTRYCKNKLVNMIIYLITIASCFLIIVSRLHYTVDVVLSLYFVLFTWNSVFADSTRKLVVRDRYLEEQKMV